MAFNGLIWIVFAIAFFVISLILFAMLRSARKKENELLIRYDDLMRKSARNEVEYVNPKLNAHLFKNSLN